MALEIFIDESGYTGERQLDSEQPVFVLSSINLDDETATKLHAEHFTGVQAKELKHSELAKRPSGQKRILNFIRSLASMNSASKRPVATAFAAHKKFELLTLIVDLWVEPTMRRDGVDMYERGGHIGFSNVAFYVLSLCPEFFGELLRRFEIMMRERTREAYQNFWNFVYRAYYNPREISPDGRVHNMIRDIIVCFMAGQNALGPQHLLSLPDHCLDVAFSTVTLTADFWHEHAGESFLLTLDESKYFAEAKWIWDALTRHDLPSATFRGSGNVNIHYPLNIKGTRAASSKDILQLQLADVVAGAVARFCASRIDPTFRSSYTDALLDVGIRSLFIGGVWPSTKVTPKEMGTEGMSGDHLDYLATQLRKRRREEPAAPDIDAGR
jgi:Protein of unknown function (DUF3800)